MSGIAENSSDENVLVRAMESIEDAEVLDTPIDRIRRVVAAVLPRPVQKLLHGAPLGHPAHPVAILVPAGAWISSAVLDFIPGQERAARTLVGVGVLGALPAAATGVADWSELDQRQQRVGVIHWGANLAAVALYSASYIQRRRGKQVSGRILGLAGLTVVSASGYIGGHLAYRQGANVVTSHDS